jgi:hypothetical protein
MLPVAVPPSFAAASAREAEPLGLRGVARALTPSRSGLESRRYRCNDRGKLRAST